MLMPEVHACAQLVTENEKLKKYLRRLKRSNQDLADQLRQLEEKTKMEAFLKNYVTTRDSHTQTDPPKQPQPTRAPVAQRKDEKYLESEKLSKMMMMHTGLMKRYEKELRTNMQHVDTITTLSVKVNELEQKLHEAAIEAAELRSSKVKAMKGKSSKPLRKISDTDCSDEESLQAELKKVKRERDRLAEDKKKLKAELRGLDHGFFEEVEDIKYALHQSTRLNKEYDSCLEKLATRFGVPHPHPERKHPS